MTCPADHPVFGAGGEGYADSIEVLAAHSTDAGVRCRLCGRAFWTIRDGGRWGFSGGREMDPDLARRALIDRDASALARLFVSHDLPRGPGWESIASRVEIFRALTPGAGDADRVRALREACAEPAAVWGRAADVLEAAVRVASHEVPEAELPLNVRLSGRTLQEWYEIGDSLVLLTAQSEMLRLEARGVTRLDVAGRPTFLAVAEDRLMLAVGEAALLVIDAAGVVSTWDAAGRATAEALDDGWWLRVPDTGESERVIELRKPDGRPCVGFKRRFEPGARYMPPPRRVGQGWLLSNLVDDDGATQVLSLVDDAFKLVAQSAGCRPGDRRVTPIDATAFVAHVDGSVERWTRRGASLDRVETIPARSATWVADRLIVETTDGRVASRDRDGTVQWTWARETEGASYLAASKWGLLFYDDRRADWLGFEGAVRRSFDVERPDVSVGRVGTVYVKSLASLWILAPDEVRRVDVAPEMGIETTCGDDVVLRDDRGACLVVDRFGRGARFDAPHAHFPVGGTRGGPWVVAGDRVRGAFERNAHTCAEAIAMTVRATSRRLAIEERAEASVVVLPDGRVPYLVRRFAPGSIRIDFAGGGGWNLGPGDDVRLVVSRAAAALEGWLASSSPAKPTLYETALTVVDLLARSFDEAWTVAIPGTGDPGEMWLHGPDRAAAAVGIFAWRVNVDSVEIVPIDTRGDLALRRDAIVAAVREQRSRYARHRVLSDAMTALAAALAARVEARLSRRCEVETWHWATYGSTVAPRIVARDDPHNALVWIRADGDTVRVHSGAAGPAGWDTVARDGDAAAVDAMIEPIVAAIERSKDLFLLGRLRGGERFRVVRAVRGFELGEVVTFQYLDDIDNHYGELVFTGADGREARFAGDFSSRDTGWAGELYLVFERA